MCNKIRLRIYYIAKYRLQSDIEPYGKEQAYEIKIIFIIFIFAYGIINTDDTIR